jgi:hypothetical protein
LKNQEDEGKAELIAKLEKELKDSKGTSAILFRAIEKGQ